MVIFSFPKLPPKPKRGILRLFTLSTKILTFPLPTTWQSKWKGIEQDFSHYQTFFSEAQVRFTAQDALTMQGQDYNKHYHTDNNKVVLDIAPVPADQGVSIFQRWVKRFAGGGPFASSSSKGKNDVQVDSSYQPTQSPWDAHIQHCPKCQRCIQRMSRWSHLAEETSQKTLAASVLFFLLASLARLSKMEAITSRLSYACLVTSVALRWAAARWKRKVEDAFVAHADAHHPKNGILFRTYAE